VIGSKIGSKQTVWEKYGKLMLICLIAFAGIYGGLQYYYHYQSEQAIKASEIYDNMLISLLKKQDKSAAKEQAEILKQQYTKTPYASLAALLLAKMEVDENQLESAMQNLKLAMQFDKNGPVHQIATIRLARVMAARENYAEALALLSPKKLPEGYAALFEETKGDIYLMQNQKEKARESYKAAQLAAPPGTPVVRLQLKQTDLGNN
jgi:predicted negative regulator of RcsB-dependent stress response